MLLQTKKTVNLQYFNSNLLYLNEGVKKIMTTIEFNESLTTRTLNKYFKSSIKSADYTEDIKVIFDKDTSIDLAGMQILYAMKEELKSNGKQLIIEGLPQLFLDYINK